MFLGTFRCDGQEPGGVNEESDTGAAALSSDKEYQSLYADAGVLRVLGRCRKSE